MKTSLMAKQSAIIVKGDSMKTTLNHLLEKMDVPTEHKNDLNWLAKNLATNNKKHPNFPEAIHLVAALLTMNGESISEIVGRN